MLRTSPNRLEAGKHNEGFKNRISFLPIFLDDLRVQRGQGPIDELQNTVGKEIL